ncbi:MAG: copper-binding protein [Brevundimonas sp.]|jgi:Cu(I)/Ag(I) efflux system protein CusF|uniref:Cation efflux system protein CusF n=3 Tax=Brevundimonas TaxID=41275 RepID=A0A2X1BAD0_BREVE|nr:MULTISPECIES: copper-binding protein [Brevundimonas]MBB5740731.1 Cu/Ag efflux protein CusF [Brevundimonas aurantiaca]QFU32263.1 Cation efflux system protein CusF precursor [Brevundimonas sp. Bb-A]SPU53400.1 Cation efflux system protein CusF precursor [Brevundimonas vesicularis]
MTRTLVSLAGAAMMLSACGQPADPAAEPAAAAPVDTASAAGAADTATSPAAGSRSGSGAGVVTAVDTAAGTVTINHEAIPAVGWPAMTMSFTADPAVAQQAAVGDRVQFDLTVQGNAGEVTAIRPE